jgi:hypothetical protein
MLFPDEWKSISGVFDAPVLPSSTSALEDVMVERAEHADRACSSTRCRQSRSTTRRNNRDEVAARIGCVNNI